MMPGVGPTTISAYLPERGDYASAEASLTYQYLAVVEKGSLNCLSKVIRCPEGRVHGCPSAHTPA
jgi:hypothetical protein